MSIFYIDDYEPVMDAGRRLPAVRLHECGRADRRGFCFRSCEATLLRHLREMGAVEGGAVVIHGEDTERAVMDIAQAIKAAGFFPFYGTEEHPLTLLDVKAK